MGKLRVLSGSEVRAILEASGFVYSHHRGSHMIMRCQTIAGNTTTSVPDHKEVAKGTLAEIIRQSGLDRSLFES